MVLLGALARDVWLGLWRFSVGFLFRRFSYACIFFLVLGLSDWFARSAFLFRDSLARKAA